MTIINSSIVENSAKNAEDVSWFFFYGGGRSSAINLKSLEADVICKSKCSNVENLVRTSCLTLKPLRRTVPTPLPFEDDLGIRTSW